MKHTLSPRQVEIMRLICRGMFPKEIAAMKSMSPRTVEAHLRTAKHRLAARNIVQAAVIFIKHQP